MKIRHGRQRIDTVFVLIIFCIFAVSVLIVLMLGATIYQNMTEISREEQEERTALSYIRTKIRNNDESGRISVGEFDGLPALFYDELFFGTQFRTVIYHNDGWIYELFSDVELGLSPEDGVRILPLSSIEFEELENGLIRISSGTKILLLFPRTGNQHLQPSSYLSEEVTLG
ncbi:MAG: DUF4860 domain-containing protein [Oscillospiraceae bacterium]|nr:DUF4860 domain-containing protein [Oscillospiraceae bacterium]